MRSRRDLAALFQWHWRIVAVLLAGMAMGGCTLVPGSHVAGAGPAAWFGDEEDDELPDMIRRYRITPSLVANMPERIPAEVSEDLSGVELDDYRVGPGDVLNIIVWNHPELTIPAGDGRSPKEVGNWVHHDGTIFYPYVGVIEVEGMKVTEIRELITERIADYIESPQVEVTVAAFRSQRVYVTGNVRKPGTYPVTNRPKRLLDAINEAGGLDEMADWRNVVLTRNGDEYSLSLRDIYRHGDPRQNILLRDGDVVHVGRVDDNRAFVLGEVMEPKPLEMGRDDLTLAEALARAGGLHEMQADATGVFVMRRGEEEGEEGSEPRIDLFQLDARQATALVLADEFVLQPRDIVYVTAAPVARWNRVISQLLPTIQTVYFGARTEREVGR